MRSMRGDGHRSDEPDGHRARCSEKRCLLCYLDMRVEGIEEGYLDETGRKAGPVIGVDGLSGAGVGLLSPFVIREGRSKRQMCGQRMHAMREMSRGRERRRRGDRSLQRGQWHPQHAHSDTLSLSDGHRNNTVILFNIFRAGSCTPVPDIIPANTPLWTHHLTIPGQTRLAVADSPDPAFY